MDVVDKAYQKAVEVLKGAQTPKGFTASHLKEDNYYAVWARDHSICAIGAVLTDDEELITTAKKGVLTLLYSQIDHGQVPSYIELENTKRKMYGGLGVITSVDSNLWIAISAAVLHMRTKDKRFISQNNMKRYQRLYRLMKAFDSNNCGLIEVPKAGDWADIFNRTYHVLYDECLYYQALKSLRYLFQQGHEKAHDEHKRKLMKRIRWITKRIPRVKKRINEMMWFTKDSIPKIFEEYMIHDQIEEKDYDYYISHIIPFKMHWQWQFDVFGNTMAILTNVADNNKTKKILKYAVHSKVNDPYPVKALDPPVYKKNLGWQSIYKLKEQPHTYHNGGIWPMIGGFWVNALTRNGYKRTARKDLEKMAKMFKRQKWGFYEYSHGKTGKAMGKKYQAWSASGYILAYHSLKKPINPFGL